MERKKIGIGKLFYNDRFVIIFSLVVAVAFWLVLSIRIGPEATRTIRNVPVVLDNSEVEQNGGMSAFYEGIRTVSVQVKGKKYALSGLTAEDLVVTAKPEFFDTAGYKRIGLNVALRNPSGDYKVTSYEPSYIDVYFDNLKTKTIKIEPDLIPFNGDQTVAPGYIQDKISLTPDSAILQGPAAFVDQVTKVVARSSAKQLLTEDATLSTQVTVRDKNGETPKFVTVNFGENAGVSMSVRVLKSQTAELALAYLNQPSDIPFPITIEPSKITIAGPEKTVTDLSRLEVGVIDFSTLTLDRTELTEQLQLPAGVKRIDSADTEIKIKLDLSDIRQNAFTIPKENLRLVNLPEGKTVNIISTSLSNVRIMGPRNVIRSLEGGDIVATIDLQNVNLVNGDQAVPVSISLPEKNNCWAIGSEYQVYIQVASS